MRGEGIRSVDRGLGPEAQARLDRLTKPLGSLGRLEEIARKYIEMTGRIDGALSRKAIYTLAADHGVTEEGVSAYPKEVTRQMVANFLAGGAGINVLARHAGAEVRVVDIGVDYDFPATPNLLSRKVARGTGNFARGPAMSGEEARSAIDVGIRLVEEADSEGIDLLGVGEMGIGNTTAASAITAAITGEDVEKVTGRGTGLDDSGLARKIAVIKRALEINRPDPRDPYDILQKIGGLEIAGICGMILAAARRRIPVVIDGFISSAAALVACEMNPLSAEYLFASHRSVEAGHPVILKRLGLVPILDLGMRLGEGTGAALAIGIIDASLKIYREMATFESAQVSNCATESAQISKKSG